MLDFSGNGATDYFSAADDAIWDLPDADWCWLWWARWPSAPTGTAFQYMMSTGGFQAANTYNFYISEDSNAVPNTFFTAFPTGQATHGVTVTDINNGKPWLISVERRSGSTNIRVCQPGDTAVQTGGTPDTVGALSPAAGINFGRRTDGETARYMSGEMGEIFKGDFALTDAQLVAIANGLHPLRLRQDWDFYWPALVDTGGNQIAPISQVTLTRNGTPGTAPHVNLVRGGPVAVTREEAAAAAASTGGLFRRGHIRGVGRGVMRGM